MRRRIINGKELNITFINQVLFSIFCFILSGVACMFFVFLFPSVLEKICHFWDSFVTVAFLYQGHVRLIGT